MGYDGDTRNRGRISQSRRVGSSEMSRCFLSVAGEMLAISNVKADASLSHNFLHVKMARLKQCNVGFEIAYHYQVEGTAKRKACKECPLGFDHRSCILT